MFVLSYVDQSPDMKPDIWTYLDISGFIYQSPDMTKQTLAFFLCLLLEGPNIGVLKVQLGTNIEERDDLFEIDIYMWVIGTQCQKSLSQ